MIKDPGQGVFKPAPSRLEAKTDATTRAANEIIRKEETARISKTERLRAARLEQEAAAPPAAGKRKPARKAGAKTDV